MNWREFLLDRRKIIVSLALLLLSSFYFFPGVFDNPYEISGHGFPLPFLQITREIFVFYPTLIIDFIFWYISSLIIIWIYDMVKKR